MMMIDKLAYSSPIRYKNTGLKGLFAIGTLLICVGFRSFTISMAVLVIMSLSVLKYSSVSPIRYFKMMAAPMIFLLLGTIAIIVDFDDKPVGLIWLAAGSKYIVITAGAVIYALRLILISLASVSCLYFLILTTTMLDLLAALKRMHCPWLLLELMMLIYRFIFVLLDIALAITRAQYCRLGNRNIKTTIYSMGNMLATLFIIAMDKSSRLFDAMESRCYDGELQVLVEHHPVEKRDAVLLGVYLLLLLGIAIICYLKGGLLWVL